MVSISTPFDYFILVIEPHAQVCEALRTILDYWGFRVLAVSTIREAEQQMRLCNFTPDAIFINIPLPYTNNDISFVMIVSKFLKSENLSIPLIATTVNADNQFCIIVEGKGWGYLLKPFSASAMFSVLMNISGWRAH